MSEAPPLSEAVLDGRLAKLATLREAIGRAVVGQHEVVEQLLIGLLAGGHCLIEGVPGLGKTLLVRSLGQALALDFRRIQFTPDLMPSDIIGTELLEEDHGTGKRYFKFQQGPVFTHLLLADELNRTPPKTQSALLQAMQERAVTLDGKTWPLSPGFMVVATQNPIEQEGTYPLPEAQLDRFLLKVVVPYPSRAEEREIVRRHGNRTAMPRLEAFGVEPVADLASLAAARAAVAGLRLSDEVADYIVDLVRATRDHASLLHGASPRAASMLATASRALAALRGRDFVLPDDVKDLFRPALQHRVILAPGAEVEGVTAQGALEQVLARVAAPR